MNIQKVLDSCLISKNITIHRFKVSQKQFPTYLYYLFFFTLFVYDTSVTIPYDTVDFFGFGAYYSFFFLFF